MFREVHFLLNQSCCFSKKQRDFLAFYQLFGCATNQRLGIAEGLALEFQMFSPSTNVNKNSKCSITSVRQPFGNTMLPAGLLLGRNAFDLSNKLNMFKICRDFR